MNNLANIIATLIATFLGVVLAFLLDEYRQNQAEQNNLMSVIAVMEGDCKTHLDNLSSVVIVDGPIPLPVPTATFSSAFNNPLILYG